MGATLVEFGRAVRVVDALGGSLTLERTGKVKVRVPVATPADILAPLADHRDLLAHVALGRGWGLRHALGVCTTCEEPCIVTVTKDRLETGNWPACRMTPGCEGRHVPVDRDIETVTHTCAERVETSA